VAAILTHGVWHVRKAGLAARLKPAGATTSGGLAGAAGKAVAAEPRRLPLTIRSPQAAQPCARLPLAGAQPVFPEAP
jgi:hypothetical protein